VTTLLWLQPWLNTVGLLLDFLGILLLAREWGIAARHDAKEAELERVEEMQRPRPMQPRPEGPHHEVHQDLRRRHAFAQRQERRRRTWSERRSWFVASFAVILLGYALQLVGSVPLGGAYP